jgi:hypothetical protein
MGNPVPIPGGGGSVLTQHQSRDTEMDGQHNTRDGSSGRPGALLEISYFADELQYVIFYIIIWVWGRWQIARIDSQQYIYILLYIRMQWVLKLQIIHAFFDTEKHPKTKNNKYIFCHF